MKYSLYLGNISGIKISVHWTFLILIFWIVFSNIRSGLTFNEIVWSVTFVLTIFLCVTLHELGHALTAKRFKIKTKEISILPIGGVARLDRIPEQPSQELVVALAGRRYAAPAIPGGARRSRRRELARLQRVRRLNDRKDER